MGKPMSETTEELRVITERIKECIAIVDELFPEDDRKPSTYVSPSNPPLGRVVAEAMETARRQQERDNEWREDR